VEHAASVRISSLCALECRPHRACSNLTVNATNHEG